ncbi:UPF0496 protein At4g34320-like [Capsella rubella]|uniref:UPF0496 protein At4g34320-like n=1 Tax=Capsella rubella TaxID=81985 RepID=UPI000CD4CBA3|nr:UPF0496 protein At4g34320-like [Capsella rubella]
MGNMICIKSNETRPKIYTNEQLRAYEAACKADTEVQSFDTRMQAQTSHVINTLATGVEVRALSLDTLKVVTGSLLDMNQDVVKVILDCKEDVWENKEMFDLVGEYFNTSLKMQDFCNALERSLKVVRLSHLLIRGALQQFNEESLVQGNNFYIS